MGYSKRLLLVITQAEWGGAQSYVFRAAKEAMRRGFDVLVAAGGEGDPSTEFIPSMSSRAKPRDEGLGTGLEAKCREANIPYRRLFRLRRDISPVRDLGAVRELMALMREWKPDIAYLHSSKAGIAGSIAARITRHTEDGKTLPRVVYRIGGWSFLDPMSPAQKTIRRWSERLTARLKDAIIVLHPDDESLARRYRIMPRERLEPVSKIAFASEARIFRARRVKNEKEYRDISTSSERVAAEKDGLPSQNGFLRQALVTIPNGLDLAAFDANLLPQDEARAILRGLWRSGVPSHAAMPDNSPLVLTVANFYATKNLTGYLEAVRLLIKLRPDARILVIGDGEERGAIEARRRALGLEEIVSLPGRRPGAASFLAGADAFVLPSLKEGMPWTLLEAMAARLPCVVTDVGANRWMVGDDGGVIVPPKDANKLAQIVAAILDDHERARGLGVSGRQIVESRFTDRAMWEATFTELDKPPTTN